MFGISSGPYFWTQRDLSRIFFPCPNCFLRFFWIQANPTSDLDPHPPRPAVSGIEDPVRPEVPGAVAKCQASGIVAGRLLKDGWFFFVAPVDLVFFGTQFFPCDFSLQREGRREPPPPMMVIFPPVMGFFSSYYLG